MSARDRLRLLLHCYRRKRHQKSAKRLFVTMLRELGKEYSSNDAGDGPTISYKDALLAGTEILALSNGRRIQPGLQVYVRWDSFPISKDARWNDYQQYYVVGVYRKQEHDGWSVYFGVLGQEWLLRRDWILEHGSNTRRPPLILTRSRFQNLREPIPSGSKRKIDSGPFPGKIIFVKWSSFPESNNECWDTMDTCNMYVQGIYKKALKHDWQVCFPALGPAPGRIHNLSRKWVLDYGSESNIPENGRELLRTEYNRYTAPLSATTSPDEPEISDDEKGASGIPTIFDMEVPDIKLVDFPPVTKREVVSGVGFININTLMPTSLSLALWMKQAGCAVSIFVDTRTQKRQQQIISNNWRQISGCDGKIFFSSQRDKVTVGGQLHAVTPEWSRFHCGTWSDASDLGIVFETKYFINGNLVRVISVYRPVQGNKDRQGLGVQLDTWLQEKRNGLDRDVYIQEQLQSRLSKRANKIIIAGDFNMSYDEIIKWPVLQGLQSSHDSKAFSSRYHGTEATGTIDFIFHTGTVENAGYSVAEQWQTYSDHRPLWVNFDCGKLPTIRKKPTFEVKMDLTKPNNLQRYQERMSVYVPDMEDSPSLRIKKLNKACKEAATTVRQHTPLIFWTPYMKALIIWRDILRDLKRSNGVTPCNPVQLAKRKIMVLADGSDIWEELLASTPEIGLKEGGTTIHRPHVAMYISNVIKQLAGRRRRERRELIQERVERIRNSPDLFYRNLRKARITLDLSKLDVSGQVLTDPFDIDTYLARTMEQQFQAPPITTNLWEEIQTFAGFNQHTPASVPSNIKQTIWKAIHSVPPGLAERVGASLTKANITPTYAEFVATLRKASKVSAGGKSGCTYAMLQNLEPDLLQQLYADSLSLWQQGVVPQWWKSKMVYPLAKKRNTYSVQNIRPIVLIEVTRKLWYKTIAQRVASILETSGILQDNQCGFRRNRSCSDNLLHLINALEVTSDGQLYGTSWDIVGAFNAPPRPWLEVSMRRLGVPSWLASTLAYIDDDDINVILTPYHKSTGQGCTFTTGRGCGQGDVISPLLWNIFFDIVLTALASVPSNISYVDATGQIHQVKDSAFADDLLSLGSSLEAIQHKASVMSGLAQVLGFELALDKFRTFTTGVPGHLVLYTAGWTPVTIDCTNDGIYRYLGSTRSYAGGSEEEARLITDSVHQTLARCHGRIHRPDHGLLYFNTAMAPMICYKAVHGSGLTNLPVYSLIHRELKGLAHLPVSFPTAVLGGPARMGGLGLRLERHYIPDAKWKLLTRLLLGPIASSRTVASAILARAARNSNGEFNGDFTIVKDSHGAWITDLFEALANINKHLVVNHGMVTNQVDVALPMQPILQQFHLHYLSDIVEVHGDALRTISTFKLPGLEGLLPQVELPLQPIYYRIGQFWTRDTCTLFEIEGWVGLKFQLRKWQRRLTNRETRSRRTATLSNVYYFGGTLQVDTFEPTHKCIITRAHDEVTLHYTAALSGAQRPTKIKPPLPFSDSRVASDGSYFESPGLFGPWRQKNSFGAVVAMSTANPQQITQHYRFTATPTSKRAFDTELLAVTCATALTAGPILSDCQSVLAVINNTKRPKHPLEALARTAADRARWTRSHPEKIKEQSAWTAADYAIAAADMIAGNQSLVTNDGLAAARLCMNIAPVWVVIGPEGILQEDIATALATQELSLYLSMRDKEPYGQVWSIESLQFLITTVGGSLAQKGSLLKLYLARFDTDRQRADGTRPICSCLCANYFETWCSTCTRPAIVAHRQTLEARLDALELPKIMRTCVDYCCQHEDKELFLRGNWQPAHREIFELGSQQNNQQTKEWQRAIRSILKCIVAYSLELYTIGNGKSIKVITRQKSIKAYFAVAQAQQMRNEAMEAHTSVGNNEQNIQQQETDIEQRIPGIVRTWNYSSASSNPGRTQQNGIAMAFPLTRQKRRQEEEVQEDHQLKTRLRGWLTQTAREPD